MNKTRHKTVLFVTPGGISAPGGITRMVDYTLRAWPAGSPFRLGVIDSYGPGPKWQMPFYASRALLETLRLLLMRQVQLLHINFSERLSIWRKGLFVLLGDFLNVPVIMHLHGAEFADYIRKSGRLRRSLVQSLLMKAQKLIVLGSFWREFLAKEMGIPYDRIAVLCNAVPDMAGDFQKAPNAECKILFLGVVCERKGVPTLLKALSGAQMLRLNWKMTIAGNGEVDVYRTSAEDLNIGARVSFPGLLAEQEVRAALKQADILVLPSRQEGLPMAILEALSYGCPVVATPVGSIPDAVIEGETGRLVPVDDAEALGHALAELVADASLRGRLGAQGRRLFKEKFTIGHYNAELESIYRELVG